MQKLLYFSCIHIQENCVHKRRRTTNGDIGPAINRTQKFNPHPKVEGGGGGGGEGGGALNLKLMSIQRSSLYIGI